jgi:DNA replication protein DnaC
MLVTVNQPFGEWRKVFPDPAMTLAAIDRLVHHFAIFEIDIESTRTRGRGTKARARSANVICHGHGYQR